VEAGRKTEADACLARVLTRDPASAPALAMQEQVRGAERGAGTYR